MEAPAAPEQDPVDDLGGIQCLRHQTQAVVAGGAVDVEPEVPSSFVHKKDGPRNFAGPA